MEIDLVKPHLQRKLLSGAAWVIDLYLSHNCVPLTIFSGGNPDGSGYSYTVGGGFPHSDCPGLFRVSENVVFIDRVTLNPTSRRIFNSLRVGTVSILTLLITSEHEFLDIVVRFL